MRYHPGQKEETRERLVAAAGRGFRRKGFAGIGVDGLAKEAAVTSGAFYGHFPSKEAAFEAAVDAGVGDLLSGVLQFREKHGAEWLPRFVEFYMSYKVTCEPGDACTMQALTPDVTRASPAVKAVFETRMIEVAQAVADGLAGGTPKDRLARAWTILSLLTGGVTLARAMASTEHTQAVAATIRTAVLAV
jgi:AcrR family transcriptional regulator